MMDHEVITFQMATIQPEFHSCSFSKTEGKMKCNTDILLEYFWKATIETILTVWIHFSCFNEMRWSQGDPGCFHMLFVLRIDYHSWQQGTSLCRKGYVITWVDQPSLLCFHLSLRSSMVSILLVTLLSVVFYYLNCLQVRSLNKRLKTTALLLLTGFTFNQMYIKWWGKLETDEWVPVNP